jgi:hypothetical protein
MNQNPLSLRGYLPLLFLLAGVLLPCQSTAAQGGDPQQEIQELARRIDEQLKEIDRLLLESGKKNQPRQKPKEMLQQSVERSRQVETGIDELIDKLNEMKNQGGGGESQDQQQQQQQDQQQQQKPGGQQGGSQRRDSQSPDFVKQPQQGEQKPGEQPGGQPEPGQPQGQPPGQQQKPGEGKPEGGQEDKGPGENRNGQAPPDQATGPGQPGQGSETWGELQGYTNALKNRGSMPKVPEKYRKYWEAYLKQKPATGGK